jgi:hypothetical protein
LLTDHATGPLHYEVVHVASPAPNVAIAQVRRSPNGAFEDAFAEIALYLPVNHQGRRWLAAGQNTPVKPGRSGTDSRLTADARDAPEPPAGTRQKTTRAKNGLFTPLPPEDKRSDN